MQTPHTGSAQEAADLLKPDASSDWPRPIKDDVAQQDNSSDCAIHVVSNAAAHLLGYANSLAIVKQWRKIIPIVIIATCYNDMHCLDQTNAQHPINSHEPVPQQGP